MALIAAGERQGVTLLTDLPLVWGEGSPADILSGKTSRSPLLEALDADFNVRPIDTLTAETLGSDIAIIAQPRLLSPRELMDLDSWVRRGGRTLIFTDPALRWPSRYAMGDARRAATVGLLDPLLLHWGLVLDDGDGQAQVRMLDGVRVATDDAGSWRKVPPNCALTSALTVDCRIGKGRAVLVADADPLDARLVERMGARNADWLVSRLRDLVDSPQELPSTGTYGVVAGAIVASLVCFALLARTRREQK